MATLANPPPGAIPTNGASDPFVGPGSGPLRYASFDTDQFSSYTSNSPSHAKRALEAHLKDTDRRIQDASRLGTTLLQQRKELSARLEDVKQVQQDNEVPADLRKKLAELEREYNEVGKESARAFLPKSTATPGATPAVLSGLARESPTKVSAPSRRQRNQPSNRVHDIEFATEISTSLLAQVRQLQAALAEKDDALSETSSNKAQLEAEAAAMLQRIKQMDDHEQRYKDENWNLEMKVQELEGELRDTVDKHDRVHQSLKSTESEKTTAQRELDELRVSHDNLAEDHEAVKRRQEGDLHSLRRDVTTHQTEKQALQREVEELTAQNVELAKAVSSRWNQPSHGADGEFVAVVDDRDDGNLTPEEMEPASPVKGTPRHGMLESETLKSSLNHAHRMIQNLKNNIHREKTEKIELKRMLQDAREELEARRSETGVGANVAKKRRSEMESGKFKKPARPDRLGANRSSTTEILEDEPDWEEHDGGSTPSKSRYASLASSATAGGVDSDGFDYAAFGGEETETTDGFETARERDTTETEAFQTSNEGMAGEDSDMTETEGGLGRSGTVRGAPSGVSPLITSKAARRRSLQSTASTSGDEEDEVRTPVQSQQPKYRLRLNRGARRSGRVGDIRDGSPSLASPTLASPTSSTGTPQPAGQSLGDELDGLEDGSVEGTPSRTSEDLAASPETERQRSVEPETPGKPEGALGDGDEKVVEDVHEPEISSPTLSPGHPQPEGEQAQTAYQANVAMLAHEFAVKKPSMVDAGVMTELWEPQQQSQPQVVVPRQTLRDRAGELVGGTLAGFGLGRIGRSKEAVHEDQVEPGAVAEEPVEQQKAVEGGRVESAASSAELPVALTGVPLVADAAEKGRAPQVVTDEELADAPQAEPKSLTQAVSEPLSAAKEHEGVQPSAVMVPLQHSEIVSQETEPIFAPREADKDMHHVADTAAMPEVPLAAAAVPLAEQYPAQRSFDFSAIDSQHFEPVATPVAPPRPLLSKRSSRRMDALYDEEEPTSDAQDFGTREIPGIETARPGAGFFASMAPMPPPPLQRKRSRSMPAARTMTKEDESLIEPKVFGGVREGTSGIPTLVFGSEDDSDHETHVPMSAVPSSVHSSEQDISTDSMIPVTKPLQIKKPMADEGSQTVVSGGEIDDMLRNKSRTSSVATTNSDAGFVTSAPGTPPGLPGQRRSIDGVVVNDPLLGRGPRRPASAGSTRSKTAARVPPPLPEDYTEKIVAAAQKGPATPGPVTTAGTMGPPIMPASAYKQNRAAKTPAERAYQERSMSRDGTTPRPVRHRDSRNAVQSPSGVSRRTSVSSFASELDERFNITRGDLMYPGDVVPSTDPRMIQAITQTMIGEYLWKYTRKAGRSETSNTRHRRFFWIHPYTRTLYWSEQDPSTAGKNMLKAKSMAIQSVRVITDDNTYPPGLHRKSIVVVTPGRDVIFTAPTGQRHETWFNALSYLLLRTEQEKQEATDTINDEDLEEFNPGFSLRRSISRITGRNGSQSRLSLSSYNSQATRRTSSPQRREAAAGGSLAQRQSQAALRAKSSAAAPTLTPAPSLAAPALAADPADLSRTSTMRSTRQSVSGRFNSLTSRFRAPTGGSSSGPRGSFSSARGRTGTSMSMRSRTTAGDPSEIYDASVVSGGESAEDLRAVIERQEREADRLENVRACCDG
ncbi:hypothetical protein B0A55_12258 [Friedmanniomyces simplex]|uniref:PH domain-containing protein n=1 Tax=Friedmanniomyces simplex TaxID=329884 RepID=A0A4U0WL52_9PEZI|nr:hypothetical protein B0A55_12258 [Friedmanniomyces simplex]